MVSREISCTSKKKAPLKWKFLLEKYAYKSHLYLSFKEKPGEGTLSARYLSEHMGWITQQRIELHCFRLVTVVKTASHCSAEEGWIKRSLNSQDFLKMSVQRACICVWLSRPASWPSNYLIWNSTEGIIKLEVVSRLLYHKLKLLVWWGESKGRVFITAQVTACQ